MSKYDWSVLSQAIESIAYTRSLEEARRAYGLPVSLPESAALSAALAETFAGGAFPALSVLGFASGTIINDGAGDATAAIQAAVNALPSAGGTVLIPPGIFKTSSTITITNPNVVIQGMGWGSVIRPANATFHIFTPLVTARGFKILNLWVQGAATTDATIQSGVFTNALAAPDDGEIAGCMFGASSSAGGSLNSAIKIDGGNRWKVHHNLVSWLWGAITNTGYGILAGTTHALEEHHNHYVGGTGRGRHACYLSGGCTDCQVGVGSIVENFTEEAYPIFSQGVQSPNTGNVIDGPLIIGGGQLTATGAAISIFGRSSRNVVRKPRIYGYAGSGVTVNNSSQNDASQTDANVIEDADIRSVSWHGIHIVGARNTKVSGGRALDIGQASSGTYVGVNAQADGSTVTDKTTITGFETRGATHRAGLQLETGTTGTTLNGNTFADGIVARMILNGCAVKGGRKNELLLGSISANNGDASVTLQASRDVEVEIFASALTANRTITLDTTNAYDGAVFTVKRTGGDTGGPWTLSVGGLKNLAQNQWCDVEYDGSAWQLVRYGTL